jgi:hypothetical protein
LELYIVLAEFLVSLTKLVKLCRCSSHLVRVTQGGFKDGEKYFYILKVDFVGEIIRLNMVFCIALKETIYVVEYVLIVNVMWGFSGKFWMNFGDKVKEFLIVSTKFWWMGQFNYLNNRQGSMYGCSLEYANYSIYTGKVMVEVSYLAGIVQVVFLTFLQFSIEIDQ